MACRLGRPAGRSRLLTSSLLIVPTQPAGLLHLARPKSETQPGRAAPRACRLVDCNGRRWSRPQARRPAFQVVGGLGVPAKPAWWGGKDGVAQRGAHLSIGDE